MSCHLFFISGTVLTTSALTLLTANSIFCHIFLFSVHCRSIGKFRIQYICIFFNFRNKKTFLWGKVGVLGGGLLNCVVRQSCCHGVSQEAGTNNCKCIEITGFRYGLVARATRC